jgi:adenosylmethionine-8-amino-7-oxononanoate aminotransferase
MALDLDMQAPRYGSTRDQLMAFFMERGVFLRPLGNTVYLMPPYVINGEELDRVYETLELLLQTI